MWTLLNWPSFLLRKPLSIRVVDVTGISGSAASPAYGIVHKVTVQRQRQGGVRFIRNFFCVPHQCFPGRVFSVRGHGLEHGEQVYDHHIAGGIVPDLWQALGDQVREAHAHLADPAFTLVNGLERDLAAKRPRLKQCLPQGIDTRDGSCRIVNPR